MPRFRFRPGLFGLGRGGYQPVVEVTVWIWLMGMCTTSSIG